MRKRWIVLGALVLLAAVLGLNTIAQNSDTKPARVNAPGGRLLDVPEGKVQVTDTPARRPRRGAPAIVLVHCYGCSLRWWDRMVPLLSERHRVVRVDLLGFGGSEKPEIDYTIPQLAGGVAGALERLGVANAVVAGHSLGFDVSVELAGSSPRLVGKLVDIDEAVDSDLVDFPLTAKLAYVPVLGQAMRPLTPDFLVEDAYADAFAPGYDVASGFENPDQTVADYRAMTYSSYKGASSESSDYGDATPLDERARATRKPLLIIFGTEDQIYSDPRKAADEYRDVPGARIELIEGAGHSPNVERPRETSRLILDFARRP